MKITIIDLKLRESHVFNARIDASKMIDVCSETLRRWEAVNQIKEYKEFIICFSTSLHKSKGKVRDNRFQ
jgi:hypothetical protein